MKIALCNEVIRDLDFASQCAFAAAVGYDGMELAPFTLGDNPHQLPQNERAHLRQVASENGLEIVGLHWLLLTPAGLSINTRDNQVRQRTVEVMKGLISLCADLGGKVLIHGSPAQRQVASGDSPHDSWLRARDTFSAIAEDAEASGVTYCIEPLSSQESNFINTVAEAVTMVEAVGSPAVRTMVDHRAARLSESIPVPSLLDRWLPTGMVQHVHFNETNRRGPGQGENLFTPVLSALLRNGYDRVVSVEPFDYFPDGRSSAARAAGFIRGILETLALIE
jgi:D-psicose/D-tagatose/L-ribulose 3-epimerase